MTPAIGRRAILVLLSALGFAVLVALPSGAEVLDAPPPLETRGPAADAGPWVVRAHFSDRSMVADLAAWTEPWEVRYDEGYLVVDVTAAEYERLIAAGFRLEIDDKLTALLNRPNLRLPGQVSGIPGYPCYRTVAETFATAESIVAARPNLATWTDIGDSWEKSNYGGSAGYDLMVLRLTNAAISGPKPKLFLMGALHAREYATAELVTRFAEFLVANYDADPDVTWLLDYHEIHLLLVANPDGRVQAETGLSWRKNTNENYCTPTSTRRGADLNRNFAFQWNCCGGSSGDECDNLYRGPVPASEPETQAVQDFIRALFPDQRAPDLESAAPDDATGLVIDIHSYGQLVLWPWGFTADTAPNHTALQTLGRKFAFYNDYSPEQAIGLYPTDGASDDSAYGEVGIAAYTIELGTAFFQSCAIFENTILPDNLPALLYAATVARTPYLTPAGPDVLDATLAPAAAFLGEPIPLTATIDDTRYNDSNGAEPSHHIAAAEYTIDTPAWITATVPITYPLAAADGAFDETIETVTVTLDTANLEAGRHTLYLRGRDAVGNWGPVSAAFLYMLEPGVSPVIEGTVREARTGKPLEAALTAGPFQTTSDPATGTYSMTVISGTHDLSAFATGYAISAAAGVVAADYQTIQQDFTLYPTCAFLEDDVESGGAGWTAGGDWAITDESAFSPTHSWTDSPDALYDDHWDYSLTSPLLDLANLAGITLSFWHQYDFESDFDFGTVEVSTDAGATWAVADSFTGEGPAGWSQREIALPELDGQANVRLRFRVVTDSNRVADGWHLDDITIVGGGARCLEPLPPAAYLPLVFKSASQLAR